MSHALRMPLSLGTFAASNRHEIRTFTESRRGCGSFATGEAQQLEGYSMVHVGDAAKGRLSVPHWWTDVNCDDNVQDMFA